MRGELQDRIRRAYEAACRQEIEALKPGNVHIFGEGHGMTAAQFLKSAEVSAPHIAGTGVPVGRRILDAARATKQAVGLNTNLGILLLCAPLARAAELAEDRPLRESLREILGGLSMADAHEVYRAITLVEPGGLGRVEKNDVRTIPDILLQDAMAEAAERDLIARQYATGFADIFGLGMEAASEARARNEEGMWPAVAVHLAFMAAYPDSHIARKYGAGTAEAVRSDAAAARAALDAAIDEPKRIEVLADFDRRLKADGLNPGTSADLTVATLFASAL